MTAFSTLPLSKEMLNNIKDIGYIQITAVQSASIPFILEGRDVLAQAKTGSGKTAAFGIGLMEGLDVDRYRVQAMVLCPTRELANQVCGELRRLARFKHNLKIVALIGGMPMRRQEHSLKHQAHVVVGTPGRVLKLLQRGSLNLDEMKMVVFDEADRMLAMGFSDQIDAIMEFAPEQRQTLCFSATFPEGVRRLSRSAMHNPEEITVEVRHDAKVIEQHFYDVPAQQKVRATVALLARHRPETTLIFCNTKDECRRVRAALDRAGVHCLEFHGDLEQRERTLVMVRFSNRSCTVLVATDVAARGLDIDELGAVFNFDVPFKSETYVHRVGRTGRAGSKGLAFSLVEPGETFRMKAINAAMDEEFVVKALDLGKEATLTGLEPPMVTLSINGGRLNKVGKGDVLGALTAKGGIAGSDVGKIDRMDNLTFVAVKRKAAQRALKVLQGAPIKGRRFLAMIND